MQSIVFEIAASTCGVIGSLLLATRSRHAGWAWVAWLASNAGWMAFGALRGHWFLMAQHAVFSASSAIGVWVATEPLPPLLQRFVGLIGIGPTMELVRRFGGVRVYVPTPERATPDHPWAAIIGADNLLALAREFGGEEHFQLPRAERAMKAVRNARIVDDYARKTAREMALEHRLTESQVVRILSTAGAKPPVDRSQRSLF